MTENVFTIYGQSGGDTLATATQSNLTIGLQFQLSVSAALTGIWFFSPSGATILPGQCGIFLISTQGLIWANSAPGWSGAAGSGWVKCEFDGQCILQANTPYKVAVFFASVANNAYSVTLGYFTSGTGANGLNNGIINVVNNAGGAGGIGNDTYISPGSAFLTYPNASTGGDQHWIDVEVTTGIPPASANPPVAGFGLASPRTWQTGDLVTTPRLRADVYNATQLLGQGRPFYFGISTPNVGNAQVQIGNLVQEANSWNVLTTQGNVLKIGPGGSGTQCQYPVPLPGWWLISGNVAQKNISGGASSNFYSWGVLYTQGTATVPTREDLGQVTGISSGTANTNLGGTSSELLLLDSASGDTVCLYGYNNVTSGCTSQMNMFAEWVGMPGSSTINGVSYTGPVGTVVAAPKPTSLWPPGPGGSLSGSVSAGGTVLTMPPVPGMRTGGLIGLDWQDSMLSQPTAEVATIASVTGGTVTVTAPLLYGHSAGAPVAVPVSSPFLNEQIRDWNNFLFYPPMLRAIQGTAAAQSLSSGAWTTLNLALSGSGVVNTIDNFGGWATTTANSYTIPVAGLYLCIGSVFILGSASAYAAGVRLIDNTGATYQGETFQVPLSTGVGVAATVRHLLRFTQGQTIAVQAFQNSGGALNTNPSQQVIAPGVTSALLTAPRLIVIWRAL